MSLPYILYWVYSAIILIVGVLALWKGGPAERWGAGLILALIVVGRILELILPRDVYPILHLVEDGLTAIGLLGVAVRYASFWLGGAMMLYAALFTLRAVYFVLDIEPNALHGAINDFCFMGIVAFMAIATGLSWRDRGRAKTAALQESGQDNADLSSSTRL